MIPPLVLLVVLLLGCLVNLGAFLWSCVLCGRRSVVWLLAFLLVPFAGLVFLVKFWSEAKRPFFLSLVGTGLMLVPALLNPQALAQGLRDRDPFHLAGPPRPGPAAPATGGAPATARPAVSETLQREQAAVETNERRQRQAQETRAAYDKHRAEADALFKDLNTRRAKLKVDDAAAVATFNAAAARYAALLEQTKAERGILDAAAAPPPAAAPAPPATAAPTPALADNKKPAASPPGLYRRSIDAARTARDAASTRTAEAGR